MRGVRVALMIALVGGVLSGCALFTIEQRGIEGPTAEDIWKARFQAINGHSPSFGDTQKFEEELDARVRAYLRDNPEAASSYRVGNLRMGRQVAVGMTKAEVTLLLGKPQDVTDDAARMEVLAGKFWPAVKPNAKEAWIYPAGWTLYFDGNKLADITRHHRAFLHP